MNVITADVHLTIVTGGAGKEATPEAVAVPDRSKAREREIVALGAELELPGWEALGYVSRLETVFGSAMYARRGCEILDWMLAGAAMILPVDSVGTTRQISRTDEDYTLE